MALENIISELRKTRTVVLILMLVGFILYLYRGLFTEVVEYKIKPHKTINETINNNVLVQEMLNDLMVKFKADRSYIFQFHNTIKYYDGSHKNHMSNSFEVCTNGISPEAHWLQNIPVSLYPIFLQQVMLKKMNYVDVNDIKEQTTRITLLKQGIKSIIISPYFDNGQFVAYIGCDYVKQKMDSTICYQDFLCYTNEIGKILTQ